MPPITPPSPPAQMLQMLNEAFPVAGSGQVRRDTPTAAR
jgi:hypothetical protein